MKVGLASRSNSDRKSHAGRTYENFCYVHPLDAQPGVEFGVWRKQALQESTIPMVRRKEDCIGVPLGQHLFDYPHIGVGDQAIYVGANMFFNSSPFAGRVWALNKAQMYAGQALTPPTPHDLVDGGNADGTPTPMVLHGAPSAPGTVYIITDDTNFSGDTFGVWQWTDSTGVAAPTSTRPFQPSL